MYVIWLYYLFVQSVVALAYYKWRQSQYVSKKEGLTMVKLEEKMMAIDPNWEQVLFEALGIFLFETEWGVYFYSPCCNNGIEIFEETEVDISSINSVNDLITIVRSSDEYSSVLQDMDFGSFTKYQLFVNLIYNLQIPTAQASQEKYGDQAEHICFFNIMYYDPYGWGLNETPIVVINMAYVERDSSYIEIELPLSMSLQETLEFIKADIDNMIKSCGDDMNIVTKLETNEVHVPQTLNELYEFVKLT